MRKEENIYELLEKYEKGSLEGKELEDFKTRLQNEPELQKKLEVLKSTNKLVILNRLREVKGLLIEEESKVKGRDGNGSKGKTIIGLTILAVLVGSIFIWSGKKSDNIIITKDQNRPIQKTAKNNPVIIPENEEVKEVITSGSIEKKKPAEQKEKTKESARLFIPGELKTKNETQSPVIIKEKDSTVASADETPTTVAATDSSTTTEKTKPCDNTKIQAGINRKEPCKADDNGEISVTQVKGGTAPYRFILNETDESLNGLFTGLKEGKYKIEIIDNEGCNMILSTFTLSGKSCRKDLYFNPYRGEELEMPTYEKSGNLTIFDKAGNLYYQERIPANETIIWNGHSISGELNAGYYIFIIQYEDGNIQEGSITITP